MSFFEKTEPADPPPELIVKWFDDFLQIFGIEI